MIILKPVASRTNVRAYLCTDTNRKLNAAIINHMYDMAVAGRYKLFIEPGNEWAKKIQVSAVIEKRYADKLADIGCELVLHLHEDELMDACPRDMLILEYDMPIADDTGHVIAYTHHVDTIILNQLRFSVMPLITVRAQHQPTRLVYGIYKTGDHPCMLPEMVMSRFTSSYRTLAEDYQFLEE